MDPGTTPHTPGISCGRFAMAMMQVDVPTTFTTSPSLTPAPMASQCASKAPTGMGMPARRPSFSAHSRRQLPGDLVRGRVPARQLRAHARQQRIDAARNSSGGSPPSAAFHIHLWPMAQTLRRTCCRAPSFRTASPPPCRNARSLTKLPRASPGCAAASAAAWRSPIPMNTRLRTTPVACRPRLDRPLGRNLGRLFLGAVVAPQVVVVQRLQPLAQRDHGRARRVQRDRLHRRAVHARRGQRRVRRLHQRAHVVHVPLRGEVRIFALANHGILRHRRTEPSPLRAVEHLKPARSACRNRHPRQSTFVPP